MSEPVYTVAKLSPEHELEAFDCGEAAYNQWLVRHAAASVQAGVSAVYVLLEAADDSTRVVGYYAINPAQIVRDDVPRSMNRGWPQIVPAWKLGKLALHVDLRAGKQAQWAANSSATPWRPSSESPTPAAGRSSSSTQPTPASSGSTRATVSRRPAPKTTYPST